MLSFLQTLVVLTAALPFGSSISTSSCPKACNELRASLPSGAVTTTPSSSAYWASQVQSIQAACYAQPATTAQVATTVQVASKHGCPFAVRGSGHSDVAGASNLANGIVLNLASFRSLVLSPDKTFVTVGAGSPWGAVYAALDPLNYTAVGGRETTVGVGGLTLGGGISYFSGQHGFACDNVLAYEIVLANGTAVNTSAAQEPDLYRALRGGGNNFGVVTRFVLAAYAYTEMQGGLTTWKDSPATQHSQVKAFTNFALTGQADPKAALFMSLDFVKSVPTWTDGLYYTAPSPPLPAVASYAPFFTPQLNSSRLASTMRTAKQASFAAELGQTQPSGRREQFHTATYIANEQLLNQIVDIYREVVAKTQAKLVNVTGGSGPLEVFTPALAFQPITQNILEKQSMRGGNVLGLRNPDMPRMLLSMSWPWRNAANDHVFIGGMDEVVTRANMAAKGVGLFDDFIYMNYAKPGEAVVQSYGAQNVQFMHQVSAKYDPQAVFQKLVPGGFKLP